MRVILKGLIDLIFPPRCLVCEDLSENSWCKKCLVSLNFIEEPICSKCGKPCAHKVDYCRECRGKRLYFSQARSLGLYEGTLKNAIQNLKYNNGKLLVSPLVNLAVQKMDPSLFDIDLVTFVPMAQGKELKRGYNQAQIIATEIGRCLEKPCSLTLKVIKRIKDQTELDLKERRKNVRGAFEGVKRREVEGKSILLVDDVYTTGATINECTKVLRQSGADKINVFTLARTK